MMINTKRIVLFLLLGMLFCVSCNDRPMADARDDQKSAQAVEAKDSIAETYESDKASEPDKESESDKASGSDKASEPDKASESDETNIVDEETEGTEQVKPTTLLYQGHASVRIVTDDGKVIYIDPFMGEGYDLSADLILMTHSHYDHTQDGLIKKKNEECKTIKWSDAHKNGQYHTFDLGYVTVEAVEAGYNKNHNVSECVGFILTFPDGCKVYFSGDTSTTPSMKQLADKDLDYAFLCCDGVYNMNVEEASECAKLINAKHTIPYHMEPVKDKSGFDQEAAESFEALGKIIVKPGEELELVR